uniref:DNA-directed RNA polymerase n=1 Tax=Phacus inflexus TaxID=461210 RepID=A0A3G3LKP2_9EUGL|nr:RNA polymerase beta'' subunit [Phacus inflexus]AYQ93288.1 RNA polymerase beta'' subunit [Phacus inflexus]
MKKRIIFNQKFDKKKIKNLINWFLNNYGSIKTCKILSKLKEIGFKYATKSGISLGPDDLIIPVIKKKLIKNTENYLNKTKLKLKYGKINQLQYNQKLIETWNITNETLKKEIIRNFKQIDLLNPVYMMIFSGARGNISQIKQIVGMRGLMSDSKGEIINMPIKNNLKEGLSENEYFISCYGARKGIIDTALKTANSGYLTRKLIYASQNVSINQPTCNTESITLIKILNFNKKNYLNTKEKILGRVINEDIQETGKNKIINKGQDICNYTAKKIIKLKKYVAIRTPLNCNLNLGICQLCYGWNLTNNKIVKLGEAVGILAAQSIGEPGTQLTMRTFHTGGIFKNEISKVILSPTDGRISFSKNNLKKIITKHGEQAFLLTNNKNFFAKGKNYKTYSITIPKFSIVFVKNGNKIFKKQVLAEVSQWKKTKNKKNNEIEQIKADNTGQIIFEKYKDKKIKDKIWIIVGKIEKYYFLYEKIFSTIKNKKTFIKNNKFFIKKNEKLKNNLKNINLLTINNKNIKKLKKTQIRNKGKNKNLYEVKLAKKENMYINKISNKKITKNCNKNIGKLFLTRNNTEVFSGLIIEKRKSCNFVKKGIAYFVQKGASLNIKNHSLIEKGTKMFDIVYEKEKTKDIVEGLPKIEEILEAKKTKNSIAIKNNTQERLKEYFNYYKKKHDNAIANEKTIRKIQTFLVKEINDVYKSQDVKISEKHIEIIVKQMTSNSIIKESGDSNFLIGEIIARNKIEKINKVLKRKIKYEPILIGISRISNFSDSFISAACFQETTRVLTKAAIMGKIDWLKGLKENIIFGNLIPTGTGYKLK